MMTQHEVPGFLAGKLPQLKNDLPSAGPETNVYQSIQVVTDFTRRMALERNFKMVEKCMALVQSIYEKGNAVVRNAVENVFVFSFSSLQALYNIIEWRIIKSHMPQGLYAIYVQQVLRSGE